MIFHNSDVFNVGYLSFKGSFKRYTKKYVILNHSHLLVYKDNSLQKLDENYLISEIVKAEIEIKKKDFYINLTLQDKVLRLKGESKGEAEDWVKWFGHAKQLADIKKI